MATRILVAIRFAIVNGEVDKSGFKNSQYIVPVLKALSRQKVEESGASPKRVAKGQKNNVAFFCRHIHFRGISPTSTPLLTLSQLSKWYALYSLLYLTPTKLSPGANTTTTTSQRSVRKDRGGQARQRARHREAQEEHQVSPLSNLGRYVGFLWSSLRSRIMLIEFQFSLLLSFVVVSFWSCCESSLTSGPPWPHGSVRSQARCAAIHLLQYPFHRYVSKSEALAVPIPTSTRDRGEWSQLHVSMVCVFGFLFLVSVSVCSNMYDLYCISVLPLKPNTICVARFTGEPRGVRSLALASPGLSSSSSF